MTNNKKIDGKLISSTLKDWIRSEVINLLDQGKIIPNLAVILVGDNPASKVYVKSKSKTAQKLGIGISDYYLPSNTSQKDLESLIEKLNNDSLINGILLQLPLPDHLDTSSLLSKINPDKDVDALTPFNAGRLVSGTPRLVPCTPLGSYILIKSRLRELSGINAVVIGRSLLFGKPMGQILLLENSTVTMTHSRTKNIKEYCKKADLIVVAAGRPEMVDSSWVNKNSIIIDVGINRVNLEDGSYKITGDVNFDSVYSVVKAITPVPGGVGPMTIACLMFNTLVATQIQNTIPPFPWNELHTKLNM
ncbi:MAG: tetrahydrofolate dehydrogenase/cyclohydrolase catalytic domain-containing protein [Pseudomonadota bacterium]|nr:tetrahydrofolate dehydrogenase/cyclohydrolase catalytic domain-containing protein [Pseudomonadota bacterium]|tara:strand:- start:622 stop:1536 length:915 start_codon:yes stop_codon:yes gene_type:complete